ncbi:MAG: LamG-like jellyroll fold domain-containing protein [Dehalococcoidia bacterium]|jgi:hypothetical protein
MDEGSGTTLVDSSSPANNGTTVGSPTWVTPGKVGSYTLSLSGSGQYATVADASCLNPSNAITLAAWIKPTKSAVATQYIIKKAHVTGGTSGYELSLASSGLVFFRINNIG